MFTVNYLFNFTISSLGVKDYICYRSFSLYLQYMYVQCEIYIDNIITIYKPRVLYTMYILHVMLYTQDHTQNYIKVQKKCYMVRDYKRCDKRIQKERKYYQTQTKKCKNQVYNSEC